MTLSLDQRWLLLHMGGWEIRVGSTGTANFELHDWLLIFSPEGDT